MSNEVRVEGADPRIGGRLLIVAAAVLWSTGGFFAKAPHFAEWSGTSLAFWRALFASALLLPMVRQPRANWMIAPMTACFVLMNVTFLSAMKLTEATNAIWLQNTAPIWVFLVSVYWLREPIDRLDLVMAGLGGAGLLLIVTMEISVAITQPDSSLVGIGFGLLAAFSYAGVVLSLRQLRAEQSSWLIALNHVTTALILAPFAVRAAAWPVGVQWLLLACFGMLQMGLPYLLFARGLRSIPSHEAAGITLLEPLLTPLWVFLAWRHHASYEPPRWWTLAGGALILAGLIVRYAAAARRARSEHPR